MSFRAMLQLEGDGASWEGRKNEGDNIAQLPRQSEAAPSCLVPTLGCTVAVKAGN